MSLSIDFRRQTEKVLTSGTTIILKKIFGKLLKTCNVDDDLGKALQLSGRFWKLNSPLKSVINEFRYFIEIEITFLRSKISNKVCLDEYVYVRIFISEIYAFFKDGSADKQLSLI